jgi:hypothetical protein
MCYTAARMFCFLLYWLSKSRIVFRVLSELRRHRARSVMASFSPEQSNGTILCNCIPER